jgi:hypothetical protein
MRPDRSARADCPSPLPVSRLRARIPNQVMSIKAAAGLVAVLLCAGCIGPFRATRPNDSCTEAVSESASNEQPSNCECNQQPCSHEQQCCHEGFAWRTGRKCLHIICLPCRVCECAVNFCAHNDADTPPAVQCPGRFQPVPTHPVFAPVSEPVADPMQL